MPDPNDPSDPVSPVPRPPSPEQTAEAPSKWTPTGPDPDPDGTRERRALAAAKALRAEIDQVRQPLGKQGIDRKGALGMIIPMQMAAAITVGAFFGHMLDKAIGGGKGFLTLFFLILGMIAAVRLVMRTLKDMNRP